jgi:5'-nucleotidase
LLFRGIHQSYICDYATKNPAKPFLLTSAGQYGTLITDIKVELDGKTGDIIKKDAKQIPVQSEAYTSGTTTVRQTSIKNLVRHQVSKRF